MEWQLLIPLIVAVIFLLVNLFRTEESPRPPRRRLPGAGPGNEIEQFLEEIQRMKQRAAEERRSEPLANRPRSARPVSAPLPVRAEALPPRRPEPPPQPRPLTVVEAIEVVVPSAPPPPPLVLMKPMPVRVAPAVLQLHSLLRSPQTMQTAVLLQEVLGPPRCRRR